MSITLQNLRWNMLSFFKDPMSRTHTIKIPLFRLFFSSMRPQGYYSRARKGIWKVQSEGLQYQIIHHAQKIFSDCDPAKSEALLIETAPVLTPRTIGRYARTFLVDDIEGETIIVVLELLPERFRKRKFLVPGSTETKMANTSKPEMMGKMKDMITQKVSAVTMAMKPPYCVERRKSKRLSTRRLRLGGLETKRFGRTTARRNGN